MGDDRKRRDLNVKGASLAGVYDYLNGGDLNWAPDRQATAGVMARWPRVGQNAVANRAFRGRVVRYLAEEEGVAQFLDGGCGQVDTVGNNVHEIVQRVNPDARVVYVDNDPMVLAHAAAMIAGRPLTAYIEADVRDVDEVLRHPETLRLIDFSRPVAILSFGVFHFLPGDLTGVAQRYVDALPPGGFWAVSHACRDGAAPGVVEASANTPGVHLVSRTTAEIEALLCGLPLLDPGLVEARDWRPDHHDEPSELPLLGAVCRKPV